MADYNPLGAARLPGVGDTVRGRRLEGDFIDTSFEFEVGKTYQELLDLLLSKHKDYGPRNIADAPGGAINGLRVRMHDKLARINNLVDNNKNPEHESLEDSFKDMANYAIIGLLVLRGKWDK
jgi:hypothetical protein